MGNQYPIYEHQPLQDSNSIRLLRIKPGSQRASGERRIELFQASLDNLPKYEALSYAWGARVPDDYVICRQRPIPVTKNCVAALRRLRHRRVKDRVLWIDAICINQNDLNERSQQVSLMNKIYSRAGRVFVWLREQGGDSAQCFRYTAGVPCPNVRFLRTLYPDGVIWANYRFVPRERVNNAFTRIVQRSWFQRTWVIQEVALAKHVSVICGENTLSWNVFSAKLASFIDSYHPPGLWGPYLVLNDKQLDWDAKDSIFRARRIYQAGKLDASMILQLTRRYFATEEKDHIYGLLGICEELAGAVGTPDYLESTQKIYTRVAEALLQSDVLPMFWAYQECHLQVSSWVPNFALSDSPWPSHCNKDANSSGGSKFQAQLAPSGAKLLVKGKILDTITAQSEAFISDLDDLSAKARTWRDWFALSQDIVTYPTGEDLQAVFWKTGSLNSISYDPHKYPRCDDEWLAAVSTSFSNPKADHIESGIAASVPVEESVNALAHLTEPLVGKTAFITSQGYFGLGHGRPQSGDNIALFAGARWPLVIREQSDDEYRLVSGCYIHGIMKGEVFPRDEAYLDWITID